MKLRTINCPPDRPANSRSELPLALQLRPVDFLKLTSLHVGHASRLSINREPSGVLNAGNASSI